MKNRRVQEWMTVAGVLILAFGLRLAHVLSVRGLSLVQPEDLDPGLYYQWARDIASGALMGTAPFVQSPLYAYLLGGYIRLFGDGIPGILIAQSLVGCATVLLTYIAGRRLFGHARGLLAALLIALYGPFIFYEGMVMKTFLSPFLTLLLLLALDQAHQSALLEQPAAPSGERPAWFRRPLPMFLLAGMVYGLTTLDRDNFILLAPALAVLALWMGGGMNRRGVKAAAVFTLGTVLLVAPVTLRNWVVAKELVLLTTGGGEVFFIGNNPDANGLYVPPPFVRPDPLYEHADFVDRASEISGRPLSPMQSSWFWFREGAKFVLQEPLAWSRLVLRKMLYFWNFFELPDNLDYEIVQRFSPLLDALNVSIPPRSRPGLWLPFTGGRLAVRLHLYSTFGTVAPLGLFGLFLTWRRWRRLMPAWVLLFGYMATVMLFFNFSRFRVPIVPLLALFAAETLVLLGHLAARLGGLIASLARRSGDLAARAAALRPRPAGVAVAILLALLVVGINLELPRGVLPAIEQSLIAGNAYYAQGDSERALDSYRVGLVLLGEGSSNTQDAAVAALTRRFGPHVSREALARELEVEAVARGPQFKGIHLGIHHGIGIALVQQAQSLLDAGQRTRALPLLDRAIAQFKEALKLAPSYMLSLRKMARAYQLKGETPTAIDWLRMAVDLWPADLQARFELAELLFNSGEYDDALRQLEEGRQANPGMPPEQMAQYYFNRGLIFVQGLGEPGRALFSFERAMELNPHHPQAARIQGAILELRARGYQPLPDEPPSSAASPVERGGR